MELADTPAIAGVSRRGLMKMGTAAGAVGLIGTQAHAASVRKIALEEHFSTPAAEARGLVARPTSNPAIFSDIERRLRDFGDERLAAMDSGGIDLSVLSLTTPGIQGEKDAATAIRLA